MKHICAYRLPDKFRQELDVLLRGEEYRVEYFSDIDALLSSLSQKRPDAIVWGEPDESEDAPDLRETMKRIPDLEYTANVVLGADDRWAHAALDAGADDYLLFPAEAAVLPAKIDRLIKKNDALRTAREQMWMAFAYRNAALSESLYVYEISLPGGAPTVLKMSEEAKKNYYPLEYYASGPESESYYHPNDWSLIAETFSPDSLKKLQESGKDELTLNYRIRSRRDTFDWVEAKLHFVRDVYGNTCAFSYVKLIDEKRREKDVLEHVLREEIDEIISIGVETGWFHSLYTSRSEIPPSDDYEKLFRENIARFASPGEAQQLADHLSIKNLVSALSAAPSATYTYWTAEPEETRRRKKITVFYADERKTDIVLVTRDITEVTREEQKHQQELEVALTAARQASAAKTNFLSRMSHEIRTPMNAIIGMNTLAAQAIGDDEKVAECLSKIGISAHYLLSLINDILDMSRIESGKMLLKNEKFYFNDFITGINSIIYNQAQAKGLDYECRIANNVSEAYIGDAMKLQQILINVLGNAVKFTARGSVTLSVEQISRTGDNEKVRFRVGDTGCGISEENLDRVFEPFEQADTTTTTAFGGTGLGLAITRSLTDIMGGTIRVRSIVGAGSEFTIDLPLTVDKTAAIHPLQEYHFDNLHTLVVDDDLITCERTSDILKDIGMVAEWVTSGADAIVKVRERFTGGRYYDFILIDWKMPDMDGIETTRNIRRIVGPDVTIIIISAYDWESIEAEARMAGANLFVTKPLFKSTLVSAFQKALGEEEEQTPVRPDFDFTGRRILVAEDNQINAEIARALLEARHFTVDVVPNGLRAMEMFVQNPVGWYSAILMDVRMPQMDGLTATRSIRHWNKSDAKTVPIIAMTANAFDEDIEKSKAAGMDAHLSKPIDPDVLYSALYRFLCEE